MVDAEDLTFVRVLGEGLVEGLGGGEVMAERFFDDEPLAGGIGLLATEEVGGGEMSGDALELAGERGQVEDTVGAQLIVGGVFDLVAQARERFRVGEVALTIREHACEAGPDLVRSWAGAGELVECGPQFRTPLVIGLGSAGEADDAAGSGELVFLVKMVEGRDELAGGEVAACAEDDDGAGLDGFTSKVQATDEEFVEGIGSVHGGERWLRACMLATLPGEAACQTGAG
jgi:hypothetical protein